MFFCVWAGKQVIPRKDLPRIYTMCLPVKDKDGGVDVTGEDGEGGLSLSSGLQDLEVRAFPNLTFVGRLPY